MTENPYWSQNPASGDIPVQLGYILQALIIPLGLRVTLPPYREQESKEYGACVFEVEHKKCLFRLAHTTPTKIGQFVTIWKRPALGSEIAPFDLSDPIEYVFIAAYNTESCGVFIFDKKILVKKDIMSVNGKGGKRAMRVYAPWTKPVVKQAIQTQKWQERYFLSLTTLSEISLNKFKKMLELVH